MLSPNQNCQFDISQKVNKVKIQDKNNVTFLFFDNDLNFTKSSFDLFLICNLSVADEPSLMMAYPIEFCPKSSPSIFLIIFLLK
jgi:hypothetical protein